MRAKEHHYSPAVRDVQVHRLRHKHGLSEPCARLVADLAWGARR